MIIANMATVRPISPQYQHTLDSAISLAKELASKNMIESGESSPKTPNSPDKRRFNFKVKHLNKRFCEASANITDIESSISYEAKQAYKSLVDDGPFNSAFQMQRHHHYHNLHHHHHHHHHHHTMEFGMRNSPNSSVHNHEQDSFSSSSLPSSSKIKPMSAFTFSVKKSFF